MKSLYNNSKLLFPLGPIKGSSGLHSHAAQIIDFLISSELCHEYFVLELASPFLPKRSKARPRITNSRSINIVIAGGILILTLVYIN